MIEYTVQVDDDGDRYWYFNGNLHREDGPALEYSDGSREWYLNGLRHREDGPAIEHADGTRYWYLNGEDYTEEDFIKETKATKLTLAEIEELLGYQIKVVNGK